MIQTLEKQLVRNIAVYLRLSKEDGDTEESESISNQRAIILDFINEKFNYENYYEYVDDGVSGATFKRPSFQKMIYELKDKQIDLVITKNLARFGRNYIEAGEYIEKLFPNNNIRYIAILDGVDNFEDRIANDFAPIKGVFNELFCKETSKSIKKSKRKKMSEGIYSCNVAPFGYKKDLENPGKLVIDEKASEIVKRIFELVLNGKTAKEVADIFNKENIITPAEYLKVKGLENRTKKTWTRAMVSRILNNRVYVGDCLRGKTQKISYKSKKKLYIKRDNQVITNDTHEPIIDREIYQKIHNNNKYGNVLQERNEIDAKFSEYMYCGICKQKMARRRSRNYLNIHCKSRNESDYLCSNNVLYIYEDLESKIIKEIRKNFEEYFKKNKLNPSLIKRYNNIKTEQIDDKLKEINKELGIIRFKISKLYNDRLQESVDEETYKKSYEILTQKRNEITEVIEKLENDKKQFSDESVSKYRKVKKLLKELDKRESI